MDAELKESGKKSLVVFWMKVTPCSQETCQRNLSQNVHDLCAGESGKRQPSACRLKKLGPWWRWLQLTSEVGWSLHPVIEFTHNAAWKFSSSQMMLQLWINRQSAPKLEGLFSRLLQSHSYLLVCPWKRQTPAALMGMTAKVLIHILWNEVSSVCFLSFTHSGGADRK